MGANNILAHFDLNIFDKYAVDGWEAINRKFYKVSDWFDRVIVDTVAVDGTGAAVRLFNILLRTIQSGRVQFYFMIIIFVLAGYIFRLNF